jgi:hypothetical protein
MSVRYVFKGQGWQLSSAKRFRGPQIKRVARTVSAPIQRHSLHAAMDVAPAMITRRATDLIYSVTRRATDLIDLASARAHGLVRQCDHCPGCLLGSRMRRGLRRLTLCPPYPRKRLGDIRIDTARVSERRIKNRFHMVSFPAVISRRPVNDKSRNKGAVGVEPTSENSDSRETTCVFRSCCGNYPATFAGCANERTRNANS